MIHSIIRCHIVPNWHISAIHSLPTDVAKTVFSVGAQDDQGWASLLHEYNISLSAAQKDKMLFALTCSRDTNKLQRYFIFLPNYSTQLMLPPRGQKWLLFLFLVSITKMLNNMHLCVCVCCRLLELGLEGKVIRSQDLSSLVLMVARNPRGHHLAWNFVKENWESLVQKLV